ncbi:class E sortase [Streptomyces sp. B6B3]|uniref:class E sortase n=1 Tax=Streptomyces sp. B6B3 TaxID=3153570 RepID=UPI00325E854E
MTTSRPDDGAGWGSEEAAYPEPGAYEAAIHSLNDPLNDPLPGGGQPSAGYPDAGGYGYDAGAEYATEYAAGYGADHGGYHNDGVGDQAGLGGAAGYEASAGYPADAGAGWHPDPGADPLPGPESLGGAPVTGASAEYGAAVGYPTEPGDPETVGLRRPTHLARGRPTPGTSGDDADPGTDAEAPVRPPDGGRAARRRAAKHGGAPAETAAAPPGHPEGGRAARRRAARTGPPPRVPEPPPDAGRAARRKAAKAAAKAAKQTGTAISNVIGELFITTGVLMMLFVVYQLWWTNIEAKAHANRERAELQESWDNPDASAEEQARDPGEFSPGEGFAVLYIPSLDVVVPIAETTDESEVLDNGMVGHYSEEDGLPTAMPWDEEGNVGLAGHRNTHGEPFRYINRLEPGDAIVIETEDAFYTYEVASRLDSTSPSNTDVLDPVPTQGGFDEPGRYVTLTTCTPEFTSTYRLIVWGQMVDERPRAEGKPDALIS